MSSIRWLLVTCSKLDGCCVVHSVVTFSGAPFSFNVDLAQGVMCLLSLSLLTSLMCVFLAVFEWQEQDRETLRNAAESRRQGGRPEAGAHPSTSQKECGKLVGPACCFCFAGSCGTLTAHPATFSRPRSSPADHRCVVITAFFPQDRALMS